MYYDAGGQGWGGHLQIGLNRHEAHGSWPHEEHALTSSTWQELNALLRLLRAFEKFLLHCTVVARGDAQIVFWILSKGGSPKEHLQAVCLEIFWLYVERHIDLRAEWILRTENQLADYLSKVRDKDDFGPSTAPSPSLHPASARAQSIASPASITQSSPDLTRSTGVFQPKPVMLSPRIGA